MHYRKFYYIQINKDKNVLDFEVRFFSYGDLIFRSGSGFFDLFYESKLSFFDYLHFSALSDSRTSEEKANIVDELFQRYEKEVAKRPEDHGMDYVHAYMVIEKVSTYFQP